MISLEPFQNLQLHGGFVIREIKITNDSIIDAIGREAVAQTSAIAKDFRLLIRAGLTDQELSITLYHEILEAAAVAVDLPPAKVIDFNEADFEQAAQTAYGRWGKASPANLNQLLQFYGFKGE